MKYKNFIYIITIFLFVLIFSNTNIYADGSSDLVLNCKANVAINADNNQIIFERNAQDKVFPASTTKVLTALLTIEKLNLNDEITITKEMVDQIPYDSSVMGIRQDEVYTVKDLLYGLLLVSGNDVAIVFADTISGSMDAFANIMNEKLEEIGCTNTHFTNSHGYHDDNHYTTAYDMAILLSYCLKNPTFKKIITTKEISVAPKNNPERVFLLENSNYLLYEDSPLYCKDIKGGKTGFTYEAEGTFLGFAKRDDMTIIIGSFGGSLDENGLSARFTDTSKISNYIFDNYEKTLIATKDSFSIELKDFNTEKIYNLGLAEDMYCIAPKDYILQYDIDLDETTPHLYDNANIGSINFSFQNSNITYSKNLVVKSTTNYYSTNSAALYISLLIVILLIVLKVKQVLFSKKKSIFYKKRHRKYLPKGS